MTEFVYIFCWLKRAGKFKFHKGICFTATSAAAVAAAAAAASGHGEIYTACASQCKILPKFGRICTLLAPLCSGSAVV